MRRHTRLKSQPGKGRVLTLGVFDGVHIGHAVIFKTLIQKARQLGVPAAVMTFYEHPHKTLAPDKRPPRLANQEQCLARMRTLGIDEVFLVRFSRTFAAILAEDFIRRILVKWLKVRHVVIGKDFIFGRHGHGNAALLKKMGKALGFGVTEVNPIRRRQGVVSSSALRRMVAAGEMEKARMLLGWPYTLHGKVVHGDGRGSKIGLPTANIKTLHEIVPQPGTYAVVVRLGGITRPGLCHIGKRPTFHKWGPQTIEVHIPGWRGKLYGRYMAVEFLARLRGEQIFVCAGALLKQVEKDWARAQKLWTKHRVGNTIMQ
ncbi:riboflavin biosynthesis protein RibF [bacterium]|nr:riboflavin biosynthesis protein RibF [bacterium]